MPESCQILIIAVGCYMVRILIIDNYRQTLTTIRSLANAGHYIILGKEIHDKVFTEFSRHIKQIWVHPNIENDDLEFIDRLKERLVSQPEIDYVFPVGEKSITCLAKHIQKLDRSKIIMPDVDTIFTCLNKNCLMKIASKSGIPMENHIFARDMSELEENVAQLGFPVVIKPNDSLKNFYDKKIITCHSQDELHSLFPNWPQNHSILIVQKLATGRRHNCYFAAFQGKMFAYFENVIIRTDRIDGSGYYVEGVSVAPTHELMEHCKKLIDLLGYYGVGCIQFLYDQHNGKIHFLELNPRLGANCALPYFCGMDFPRYAVECMQKGFIPPNTINQHYPANKRMHWLMGDISGLIAEIQSNNITPYLSVKWIWCIGVALIRSNYHITWCWKDPLPTTFIYFEFLRRAVSKLLRLVRNKGLC